MKKYFLWIFIGFFAVPCLHAENSKGSQPLSPGVVNQAAPEEEKEYTDAVVLLIDHQSGLLGVSFTNEDTDKEEKVSFKVDPQAVDVTNALNAVLEFSNVKEGDRIDIIIAKDKAGKEIVTEIMDTNAVEDEG